MGCLMDVIAALPSRSLFAVGCVVGSPFISLLPAVPFLVAYFPTVFKLVRRRKDKELLQMNAS